MSAASYQTLRSHLAYLRLARAEEALATEMEAARAQKLSHVEFLERLLAEEVEATRAVRLGISRATIYRKIRSFGIVVEAEPHH